jgi:putative ABC transport system permease protein
MSRPWLVSVVRNLLRRDRVEKDLDEEVRSYVDLLTDEKTVAGVPEQAAGRAALVEVGGLEQVKEQVREQRAGAVLEHFFQDVRYGLRMAARNPTFAGVVVLTLAIGIGATTAVFSVIDAVLLNPLPFPRADRIVTVWQHNANAPTERLAGSPANFLDWRERSASFDGLAAIEPSGLEFVFDGEPQNLRIWRVSEGFFEILGVRALHGRTFTTDEYQPGTGGAVVLSYGFWRQQLAGDPDVVGRTLPLSGRSYVVVGIMPAEFDFPPGRVLWAPRAFTERDRQNRAGNYLNTIALLKPGVTVDVASAEMRDLAELLSREYPATNRNIGVSIIPLRDRLVGHVRPYLILLTGAVALVLLITCVNVANVLLARGAARSQELAVRAALGARRTRLFGQLLVENLVLALLGGALGVVAAHWSVRAFTALAPGDVPRLEEAGINGTVLVFAIALSCATALLFGVLPARHFSKVKAEAALREGPRGDAHAVANRTRRVLVIGEVALALTLLTGASLLTRSFMNLLRVDPGFSTENVVALPVFVWSRYPTEVQRATFFRETVRRIEAVPGVTAAGAASTIPFSEVLGDTRTRLAIEGRPTAADARPTIGVNVATPGYFRAMGIAVARGRTFDPTDLRDTTPVAVVNETMARRFWSGEDALGKRIHVNDGPDVTREIIGIVRDTRDTGLDAAPAPTVFLPHEQYPIGEMTYVVRSATDPASIVSAVKGAVWSINKQLPFRPITTLQQLVATSIAPRQFVLVLMGAFGVVGLFLAALGLFGLVNHLVVQRTHEMGLRIALGAAPHRIVQALVGEGIRLAGIGVAVGLVGAVGLTQSLSGLVYGVQPTDPLAFAAAILLVLIVAAVASYLPARRAAALSPMVALRTE